MAKPTPIETLEQLINLAELVHHPDGDTELTDAARKALAEVEAVVAFAQRIGYDEELSYLACPGPPNCGGAGAHYDQCPVALARAALAPFGKEGS